MSDRLPPIPSEHWTAHQREAAEEVIRGPRGALISPFVPLLRSPELMRHAQRMGEYLRYRSALGLRLSELAILLVARYWSQQVEWTIHAPIARLEGVTVDTLKSIAEGRRPEKLPEDEAIVYDLCMELNVNRGVSDATWARAQAAFGDHGIVDLIGINGYYTMLAMVMNAARTEIPAGATEKLPALYPS